MSMLLLFFSQFNTSWSHRIQRYISLEHLSQELKFMENCHDWVKPTPAAKTKSPALNTGSGHKTAPRTECQMWHVPGMFLLREVGAGTGVCVRVTLAKRLWHQEQGFSPSSLPQYMNQSQTSVPPRDAQTAQSETRSQNSCRGAEDNFCKRASSHFLHAPQQGLPGKFLSAAVILSSILPLPKHSQPDAVQTSWSIFDHYTVLTTRPSSLWSQTSACLACIALFSPTM